MQIGQVMTTEAHTVEPSERVEEAARMMRDHDIGALPVCEGETVLGIVTDRDLVIRALAGGAHGQRVADVMSTDVLTVGPGSTIEHAEALMSEHQVRRLPVCRNGRIVGMLTQGDIARLSTPVEVGMLVHAISERPAIAPA